jgi:hypothetical protein
VSKSKGIIALICILSASPVSSKTPSAMDVITLAQSGASVFYHRSACASPTANVIRLDVSMFAAKYVPLSEVKTVMFEFDKELERMGYGNPYMKHRCDRQHILIVERLYYSYKAELEKTK